MLFTTRELTNANFASNMYGVFAGRGGCYFLDLFLFPFLGGGSFPSGDLTDAWVLDVRVCINTEKSRGWSDLIVFCGTDVLF